MQLPPGDAAVSANLLEFGLFRLRLLAKRKLPVGIFRGTKKILMGGASLDPAAALRNAGAGKATLREGCKPVCAREVLQNPLQFLGCIRRLARHQKGAGASLCFTDHALAS
jgi:hypothetical protein